MIKMEERREQPIVFNKTLKAGKRTYFFDVKETSNGEYYLSLTESKRFFDKDDGSFYYKKRSLFLYKENMKAFQENLEDVLKFIEDNQGFETEYNNDYHSEQNNTEE
jgi:hypothetical protein